METKNFREKPVPAGACSRALPCNSHASAAASLPPRSPPAGRGTRRTESARARTRRRTPRADRWPPAQGIENYPRPGAVPTATGPSTTCGRTGGSTRPGKNEDLRAGGNPGRQSANLATQNGANLGQDYHEVEAFDGLVAWKRRLFRPARALPRTHGGPDGETTSIHQRWLLHPFVPPLVGQVCLPLPERRAGPGPQGLPSSSATGRNNVRSWFYFDKEDVPS